MKKASFCYPSLQLSPYISKYWYNTDINFIPILPPGSGCELFIFNKKVLVIDDSKLYESHYIDAILTRPRHGLIRFLCDEQTSFVSIRFRLGCINDFTGCLESDYSTLIHPNELWGKSFDILQDRLLNTEKISQKINIIEQFLIKILLITSVPKVELAKFFLDKIYYHHNNLSLPQIIKITGYSERYLQKTVKLVTGLTLIEAKKIIRFEHAAKTMFSQDVLDHSKSYLADYYDQSHFIKDFKCFTNMSPHQFLTNYQDSALFYKNMLREYKK